MSLAFGWSEASALGSIVGGLATAFALFAALWVIRAEARTRRDEQADRDHERRDEERRQARLVYAMLGDVEIVDHGDGLGDLSSVGVTVYNHSDAPVWDAKVFVPGRERGPLLVETVPPHATGTNGWLDAPPDWYLMNVGAGCAGTPTTIGLDVIFVDNAGRRWRRSGRGEPVRLLDGDDLPALDGV